MASEQKLQFSEGGDIPELINISEINLERVIDNSSSSKMITFQGFYRKEPIVIRLDKTAITDQAAKEFLTNPNTIANRSFVNEIYSSYILKPDISTGSINDIQATIVWPANDNVLAKYTRDDTIFVNETPEDYKKIIEPFIEQLLIDNKSYNNWIYNILEGRSEIERVIFNDTDANSGFLLIPDLKWSGLVEDLNLLAICHRHDIRSIRDLNEQHLPLLKNILINGNKTLYERFPECKGKLRSYVHYHPSFYHFHVHFKVADSNNYQCSDRDNLLTTVINNISLVGDYYVKSTLTYPLSKSNPLFSRFKQKCLSD